MPLVRRMEGMLLLVAVSLSAGLLMAEESAGGQVVRVLQPKYRTLEEVTAMVHPLLSQEGSVLLQPRTKSLTVKDRAEAIDRIVRMLDAIDIPPRALAISVTLLRAGRGTSPGDSQKETPEMAIVRERLKQLFHFESYSILETVSLIGAEGNSAGFPLGSDYRVDFRLDPSLDPATTRVKDLVLSRQREEGKKLVWKDLLRTSLNVTIGQPFVLGIGMDESASGALFLVFHTSTPRGPGIGGLRSP